MTEGQPPCEALVARIDAARDEARPFAGVPIAVKDLFDVAGRETTACSAAFTGNVATKDAPTIAALRQSSGEAGKFSSNRPSVTKTSPDSAMRM